MEQKEKKEGFKETKKIEKEHIPTKEEIKKEDAIFKRLSKKLKGFVFRKK